MWIKIPFNPCLGLARMCVHHAKYHISLQEFWAVTRSRNFCRKSEPLQEIWLLQEIWNMVFWCKNDPVVEWNDPTHGLGAS